MEWFLIIANEVIDFISDLADFQCKIYHTAKYKLLLVKKFMNIFEILWEKKHKWLTKLLWMLKENLS